MICKSEISKELEKIADKVIDSLIVRKNEEIDFIEKLILFLVKTYPKGYRIDKNVIFSEYQIRLSKYITNSNILDLKDLLENYSVISLGFRLYDSNTKQYISLDKIGKTHKINKILTGVKYTFK